MPHKTKVLHIITRLDKGGSAENTFLTVKGLDKEKYDVTLMSGPVEDASQERRTQVEESGIRYIPLPGLVRNIHPVSDLIALFRIRRFLAKEKFNVVHTHTSKAGFLGRFAAKRAGTPHVIHTPHGHIFYGYFGRLKTKMFIWLEKFASRMTDKIVALTESEKSDYIAHKIVDEKKCAVIHSGIEMDRYRELALEDKNKLKEEIGIPEDALVAGTVGRLVPVKGPEFMIKASRHIISKSPQTYFVFAGDGPLKENLQALARETGTDTNVIFLGWRDDVPRILSVFDIFLLPSLNEGMGRVLAEAMALGKPIVASNVGGVPDLVTHGKNGFLVPPKNPEELARYTQLLLEDKDKRETMGRAGKEMASGFTHEAMVQKITNLYDKLTK
jgi:glycosyltransferase involved in cell wall biosynthesis